MKRQLENDQTATKPEPLVLSRTDDGFRVYSPANPTKSYIVGGSPDAPTCTCPDFQDGDPNQHCRHIRAVLDQFDQKGPTPEEIEERLAIQNEGKAPEEKPIVIQKNGGSQMLIKRSVSPDGRIDSLSIECSFPLDEASVQEIKTRAAKTLRLQSEIIGGFMNGKPRENSGQRTGEESNGPVTARLLSVGGMDGKWGRRLFINVQVNGRTVKLFGNRKQLAEQVAAAGFPDYAQGIEEGATLNLPCRVTTKPSEDGRFVNVEKVLPADPAPPQRRVW